MNIFFNLVKITLFKDSKSNSRFNIEPLNFLHFRYCNTVFDQDSYLMESFSADMVDAQGLINNEPMTQVELMMNGGLSTNDTQVVLGEQFNDKHGIACHA